MDKAEQPTIALLPCPFCQMPVQHRFALHVSDGNTDDIIHAAPAECGLQYFSVGSADQGVTVANAWNTRTPSLAAQDGLVEAAEGLLNWHDRGLHRDTIGSEVVADNLRKALSARVETLEAALRRCFKGETQAIIPFTNPLLSSEVRR